MKEKKKALTILILTIFFGWAGVYRFNKGQAGMFLLYLFTLGLCGLGWLYDVLAALEDYLKVNKLIKANGNISINEDQQKNQQTEASFLSQHFNLYKTYEKVDLFCEGDQRPDYDEIKVGDAIQFELDEFNIHDNKTINVYNQAMNFCGYMYNNKLRDMVSDYINSESKGVVKGNISYINNEQSIVRLNLYFYNHKPATMYYINLKTKMIHCSGCSTLKNSTQIIKSTDISAYKAKGFKTCGICKPF